MTRDITQRLGVREREGYAGIKKHAFWKHLDWDKLETKQLTPPFVPDVKKANFDATLELEELLLEDNPLIQKSQRSAKSLPKDVSKQCKSIKLFNF